MKETCVSVSHLLFIINPQKYHDFCLFNKEFVPCCQMVNHIKDSILKKKQEFTGLQLLGGISGKRKL